MNKHTATDIVILAIAPVLSFVLVWAAIMSGFMPFDFNLNRVIQFSFAPIVWFTHVGLEAFILWVLPAIVLALLVTSWHKVWHKRAHLFASLFTLCWIAIVQLYILADAMGAC